LKRRWRVFERSGAGALRRRPSSAPPADPDFGVCPGGKPDPARKAALVSRSAILTKGGVRIFHWRSRRPEKKGKEKQKKADGPAGGRRRVCLVRRARFARRTRRGTVLGTGLGRFEKGQGKRSRSVTSTSARCDRRALVRGRPPIHSAQARRFRSRPAQSSRFLGTIPGSGFVRRMARSTRGCARVVRNKKISCSSSNVLASLGRRTRGTAALLTILHGEPPARTGGRERGRRVFGFGGALGGRSAPHGDSD